MRDMRDLLQMFADGGDGGAGAAPASGADTAAEPGVNPSDAGKKGKNRRENPLANVKFGIDPNAGSPEAAAPVEQPKEDKQADGTAAQDRQEEDFESLIKGKYKSDFDARVQEIIGKRFKTAERDKKTLVALEPILQSLSSKHEIDISDLNEETLKKLTSAVEEDESYFEHEADKRGMSVKSLREFKKMEADAKKREKADEQSRQEAESKASFERLVKQAEVAKKTYPGFDLRAEMQDERFMRLVSNNVDAQTAYEVCHRDEVIRGSMQFAAQKAAQQVSNAVAANSARPSEGALGTPAPAQISITDPRKLTRDMRKELRDRVRRGEKIYW